ncbi:DUF6771 family protein [Novosphingobium sp. MMS21-SN21R]|uniref:DUF6771 family protein n=1 Tax=Novosphingobium sp. MMS21-SN21R TaxID=2969298 RepID=UPI002884737D|nr:DUF6771 family protein [Novosphingobium sp. MMS21-SN21R]MDT0508578.1 DUF6771 family protein [Novosphingobium sp. MMS21-SN21R]
MTRIEERQIAEALLAAPGWARVGISDPTRWMREDAARELAHEIMHRAETDQPERPDAAGMIL